MLISQKEKISKLLADAQESKSELEIQIVKQNEVISAFEKELNSKKADIMDIEVKNPAFERMSGYKLALQEYENLKEKLSKNKIFSDRLLFLQAVFLVFLPKKGFIFRKFMIEYA